jgi:hypothetical protein
MMKRHLLRVLLVFCFFANKTAHTMSPTGATGVTGATGMTGTSGATGPMITPMQFGLLSSYQLFNPNQVQIGNMHFSSQTLSYVQGGITFVYPAGLFTQAPTVVLTVAPTPFNGSLSNYSPTVMSNSASSTEVHVSVTTLIALTEALTGSVNVHLFAVGI